MKKYVRTMSACMCAAILMTACTTTKPPAENGETNEPAPIETAADPSAAEEISYSPDQSAYLEHVDITYARELMDRVMAIKSNEDLGYRPAGSEAELLTGDLLFEEMKTIGLQNVAKDEFTLDTWEFQHANLTFSTGDGVEKTAILGGYQTTFVTEGPQTFTIVYAGQGTEADYEGLDVNGKLVLIDINQRDNWWINYPAYEAHLKGAAAVIAVQDGGYSEVSDEALNAQDICGPADAPAFSMSRADAELLKANMADNELTVTFDANSEVTLEGTSYNITGVIPGRNPDQMILMSAHYDAYFDGFQDNTAAVGLMFGIAKAIADSGYQPEKTLVFCAVAAEEWGVSNSRYDWSTGAYNQIFKVHPEWRGKVMANINFELPAYDFGDATAQIRNAYELKTFMDNFAPWVPAVEGVYPDGLEVIVPTQTWSDDFSFSIAGIPASVNNLRDEFAQSHYHSQFDNADTYSPEAFLYNHNMYGLLMLAYDKCLVSPLSFETRLDAMIDAVNVDLITASGGNADELVAALNQAKDMAAKADESIAALNEAYKEALAAGDIERADALAAENQTLYAAVLDAFQHAEDSFVRLTWEDVSSFPHELPQMNLEALDGAIERLNNGDVAAALDEYLYLVDNNWYAYDFSKETYEYFTNYVLNAPEDQLMWGAGRIVGHEDLFDVIDSLMAKRDLENADFTNEIQILTQSSDSQKDLLVTLVDEEIDNLKQFTEKLEAIK